MDEYLGARLNHPGDVKHVSDSLRKDCFNMNNRRNRDLFSLIRATTGLDYIPLNYTGISRPCLIEDAIIASISKNAKPDLLSKKEFLQLENQLTAEAKEFYYTHYNIKKDPLS